MMETVLIKVSEGYIKKFQAVAVEYDYGLPFGDGDTIQEALDDLVEMYWLKFDKQLTYTWI